MNDDEDYYARQSRRGRDGIWLLLNLTLLILAGIGAWTVLYGICRGLAMLWSIIT